MNSEVLNAHVCKLTSYLLKARVCLLVYLGIDSLNSFLTVGVQGIAFRAAYVAAPVKRSTAKCSQKSVAPCSDSTHGGGRYYHK